MITRGGEVSDFPEEVTGAGLGEEPVDEVGEGAGSSKPELGRGGKRGVVLAAGGAPVTGGAEGRGGGTGVAGGRATLGIGLVTAVDQAGGIFWTGTGVGFNPVLSGRVVAAEMLGRGVIWADKGFRGRGGRLMRSVSRLGGVGSEP